MTRNPALEEACADIERAMKEARERSPFKDVPLKRGGGLVPGNRQHARPHGPGRGAVVVSDDDPVSERLSGWSDLYAFGRDVNERRKKAAMQPKRQAAE